jgi:hypothetical protein
MPLALAIAVFVFLTAGAVSEDWSSYKPAHTLGSGQDDWWTTYPAESAKRGVAVQHLDWVLDQMKEKPVLILVHSKTCKPCIVQMANIGDVLANLGSDVKYYDILAEGNNIPKAMEILQAYGLSEQGYVPTTIFLTLIKGADGKVGVAWYSVEDAMSVDEITSFVKDAIYYHQQNVGGWR